MTPASLPFVETAHRGHPLRYRLTPGARPDAPVVLFLSGAFQSMRSWGRFERRLGGRFRTLTLDLPGAGDTPALPAGRGLDFLAGAVRRVLDECGLARVHVVSASYGTPVAYRFARLYPERVESLILAGIMREIPRARRRSVERSLELARPGRTAEFVEAVLDGLLRRDGAVRIAHAALAERLLRRSLQAMGRADLERYRENTLRLLRHPPLDLAEAPVARTLVFTGEHDGFTPPAACREIADAIDGSRFTVVRDADHLFHLERFETTAQLIERFVSGETLEGIPDIGPVETVRRSRAA